MNIFVVYLYFHDPKFNRSIRESMDPGLRSQKYADPEIQVAEFQPKHRRQMFVEFQLRRNY